MNRSSRKNIFARLAGQESETESESDYSTSESDIEEENIKDVEALMPNENIITKCRAKECTQDHWHPWHTPASRYSCGPFPPY